MYFKSEKEVFHLKYKPIFTKKSGPILDRFFLYIQKTKKSPGSFLSGGFPIKIIYENTPYPNPAGGKKSY